MKNPNRPHRRRLALDLDTGLHRRLKIAAAQAGEPIRAIAERGIDGELRRLERRVQAAREVQT